jgi:DNA gyrase subunit B
LSADQTTFTIKDDGQAITHEVQEDTGKSTLLAIFTVIHSGGKFSDKVSKGKVYKTAGGLHGVGATVINALSKSLRVESSRQGKTEILTFVQGELTSAQIIDTPERIDGLTLEFTPDPEIFEEFTYFKTEIIQGRLRELAYLNPHLIFHFSCPPEAEPTVYHFAGGLASLIEEINQDQETLSEICYEE